MAMLPSKHAASFGGSGSRDVQGVVDGPEHAASFRGSGRRGLRGIMVGPEHAASFGGSQPAAAYEGLWMGPSMPLCSVDWAVVAYEGLRWDPSKP